MKMQHVGEWMAWWWGRWELRRLCIYGESVCESGVHGAKSCVNPYTSGRLLASSPDAVKCVSMCGFRQPASQPAPVPC